MQSFLPYTKRAFTICLVQAPSSNLLLLMSCNLVVMKVILLAGTFRILGVSMIYLILRSVYRLTYHPLAKFPGPRWAAITPMYAGLYDLSFKTSFCKQLPALHARYGPIIRIRPNELHVLDIAAYNQRGVLADSK